MTRWLSYHPRITAWLFFPIAPIMHVAIFILELQDPWDSFWHDAKEAGADTWKSLKKFYSKYPAALYENLAEYRKVYERNQK